MDQGQAGLGCLMFGLFGSQRLCLELVEQNMLQGEAEIPGKHCYSAALRSKGCAPDFLTPWCLQQDTQDNRVRILEHYMMLREKQCLIYGTC